MSSVHDVAQHGVASPADARAGLLAAMPVTERRMALAGMDTAVLEGGSGTPIVLLHGPGEFAAHWLRVVPELVRTHRVVAPDLPGHGASVAQDVALDADLVLRWLDELIARTCPSPPVLVGRVVGGAIAARFAARHGERLAQLVLVDTLGLGPFQPAARFELALHRFLSTPSARSYDRLMQLCSFDLDAVIDGVGPRWPEFEAYAVDRAATPSVLAAMGSIMGAFGVPPIPASELGAIAVPTTLIWGRHDLATPLAVAEEASARYGWPLHVIEDAADDPPFEQPDAFLQALRAALDASEAAVAR